ncbi:MAG: hypothetical protein JW867_05255 [Candidatus Omnitrophica bacterium]|nr:hypothetical protein [Candidatus Omnitrophota bacterium]
MKNAELADTRKIKHLLKSKTPFFLSALAILICCQVNGFEQKVEFKEGEEVSFTALENIKISYELLSRKIESGRENGYSMKAYFFCKNEDTTEKNLAIKVAVYDIEDNFLCQSKESYYTLYPSYARLINLFFLCDDLKNLPAYSIITIEEKDQEQ